MLNPNRYSTNPNWPSLSGSRKDYNYKTLMSRSSTKLVTLIKGTKKYIGIGYYLHQTIGYRNIKKKFSRSGIKNRKKIIEQCLRGN
jgi:hypothetical protein